MSNDFEHAQNPDSTVWILNGGKEMVEQRICSITIHELRRKWEWESREVLPVYNQHPFELGKVKFKLIRDPVHANEWNIRIMEPGPECRETIIDIVRTRCNYGGYREWFVCQGCYNKAGILYRNKNMFKCRKCLNLVYYSQKLNYRSLQPAIQHKHKADEMVGKYPHQISRTYNGKPTRKTVSYEKLRAKSFAGFDYYGTIFKKKHDKEL